MSRAILSSSMQLTFAKKTTDCMQAVFIPMKEYQCTINCSVCLADGDNDSMTVADHARIPPWKCTRRKVFNFRGRKKSRATSENERKKGKREEGRERETEKGDDRYPIIAEDRLAWPKIVHVKPRHRRLDYLASEIIFLDKPYSSSNKRYDLTKRFVASSGQLIRS